MQVSGFRFSPLVGRLTLLALMAIFFWALYSGMPIHFMVRQHYHTWLEMRLEEDRTGLDDEEPVAALTPLQVAVNLQCLPCARLLLQAGASREKPMARSQDHGYRPLHLAAIKGDLEMVRLLASAGAAINGTDSFNCTPLFYAVRYRHEGLVGQFLKLGADPNHVSSCGWSPLHWAALDSLNEAVPDLVEAGADLTKPVLVRYEMEKYAVPRPDKQVGTLKLTCWSDLRGEGNQETVTVNLYNWSDAPEEHLPAMRGEGNPQPQLMTPLDLSRLLKRDTITAYLEARTRKKEP